MRIAVDVFGGDHAPDEILKGAGMAAAEYGHDVLLFGDEQKIAASALRTGVSLGGMEIVHTTDAIAMEEEPKTILKAHKDSSMGLALRALPEGRADACVSAGSTGALIMGATFFVKRIKGVSRVALAPTLPTDTGFCLLCDSGANVECRPEMLLQFARMATVYMSCVMGRQNPTVGLVNIGTEECKGGELQHDTFELLKNSGIPFVGNIEARQIPFGVSDVVLADGFTGNIVLKMMEGTADIIMKNIKAIFYTNWRTKIAGKLITPYMADFKKKMNTEEYGGAPILGVAHPVIKAHGNSKATAFKNAIRVAADFAASGAVGQMETALSEN
ncbi:MAG: phosphate acyltransferase PlsX [Oscillospiraceae bacterium]|nr:phosphate acyltransferase PlsX [Oscillospiraceae bacterium]